MVDPTHGGSGVGSRTGGVQGPAGAGVGVVQGLVEAGVGEDLAAVQEVKACCRSSSGKGYRSVGYSSSRPRLLPMSMPNRAKGPNFWCPPVAQWVG